MSRSGNYEQLHRDHMKQLINTRAQILHELNQTSISDAGGNRAYDGASSSGSGVKLPKIHGATTGGGGAGMSRRGKRSVVDEAVSLSVTAPNLMMSYRQIGGGASSNKGHGKKKEKATIVKLPIFRLPQANVQTLIQANQLEQARLNSQHGGRGGPGSNRRLFLSYSDYKTLKKALLVMLQQLTPEEKDKLAKPNNLRPEDFDDALYQLKRRLEGEGGGARGGNMTSSSGSHHHTYGDPLNQPDIMENFFATTITIGGDGGHGHNHGHHGGGSSSSSHTSHGSHHHHVIPAQSLFSAARAKIVSMNDGDVSLNGGSTGGGSSSYAESMFRQKESLRTVSAGMNLGAIGISSQFQDFLLADDATRLAAQRGGSRVLFPPTSGSNGSVSSFSTSKKNNQHSSYDPLVKSSSYSSLTPFAAQNSQSVPGDSKQLTSQLLTSLMSVQKHSSLVKKSLEDAQQLLSTLNKEQQQQQQQITITPTKTSGTATPAGRTRSRTSSDIGASHAYGHSHSQTLAQSQAQAVHHTNKAKEAIQMLAAERLQKSIYKLVLLDVQRGFIAWTIFVKQQRRSDRIKRLLRSLVIRNIVLGLQKLLHKLLHENMKIWKQFTHFETQRLRKQRILQATITIQCCIRKALAKKKVKFLRQRKKYEKLYDSTIIIQALLRGKRLRWKYLKMLDDRKRLQATLLIQRVYRGYVGRKRVAAIRFRRNRNLAATMIQCMIRSRIAREKVKKLRQARKEKRAATKMQSLIRGFVARRNIALMIINRRRHINAIKIQARVRGMLTRMNRHKKLKEIEEYRRRRYQAATKVQSLYRGYRSRIIYKIMLFQMRKEKEEKNKAATQINRIIRGFLARRQLEALREERNEMWIVNARKWQEMWSDDSQMWFYFNNDTKEAVWEPTKEGYTKSDGKLVLASGEIIDDPNLAALEQQNDPNAVASQQPEKKKVRKVQQSKLCSECSENIAIRKCNECGDQFCTRCYKQTHSIGSRRTHIYTNIGPKSCDDCECLLAERFCVTCDENFCDKCWRKLHSHGKRVFHPFCEISAEGRVDPRILTMDGQQVNSFYMFGISCIHLFFFVVGGWLRCYLCTTTCGKSAIDNICRQCVAAANAENATARSMVCTTLQRRKHSRILWQL